MIHRLQRMTHAIAEVWRELDHAQRRMFELRTELPDSAGPGAASSARVGAGCAAASVRALESLWSLPSRMPASTRGEGLGDGQARSA
jgi:hypothetical protein